MELSEILVRSSYDGSMQPSLFAKAGEDRPLMIALHTWSYDRHNRAKQMLPLAEEFDLNLLLPEFRGPNLSSNPNGTLACGSDAAIADIFDAISYCRENFGFDEDAIFLNGLSGGGHMALLTVKENPSMFKATSAFVSITDLNLWAKQNEGYREHIISCTGGDPAEMAKRSPINYAKELSKANIKLFHGKDDDCVPMEHSLKLYNAIRAENPNAEIYLDIFKGGHEINYNLLREWLKGEMFSNLERVTG